MQAQSLGFRCLLLQDHDPDICKLTHVRQGVAGVFGNRCMSESTMEIKVSKS